MISVWAVSQNPSPNKIALVKRNIYSYVYVWKRAKPVLKKGLCENHLPGWERVGDSDCCEWKQVFTCPPSMLCWVSIWGFMLSASYIELLWLLQGSDWSKVTGYSGLVLDTVCMCYMYRFYKIRCPHACKGIPYKMLSCSSSTRTVPVLLVC